MSREENLYWMTSFFVSAVWLSWLGDAHGAERLMHLAVMNYRALGSR